MQQPSYPPSQSQSQPAQPPYTPSPSPSHTSPQPQLLHELRQKSLTLSHKLQSLTKHTKQQQQCKLKLQEELRKINEEREVQEKKYRSLVVLLNQLQQSYDGERVELGKEAGWDQGALGMELAVLRFILIGRTQAVKQAQKLSNFLKTTLLTNQPPKTPHPRPNPHPSLKQTLKSSPTLDTQSQTLAKLRSHLHLLTNTTLQCKRRWYTLQEQTRHAENYNKLLTVQNQRQKVQLRVMYEEYVERVSEMKGRVVMFNETQKEGVVGEYLVGEVAGLQQRRVDVEEEAANLQYHFESLKQQHNRLQIQNKQLKSFFAEPHPSTHSTPTPNKQSTLASKLKKRIQQLRDTLLQLKHRNTAPRNLKLRKILTHLQSYHSQLHDSNNYLELKTREQQHYGSVLDEKSVAEFFNRLLEEKDRVVAVMGEEEAGLRERVREAGVARELALQQIKGIEENLEVGGIGSGGVVAVGEIGGFGGDRYVYRAGMGMGDSIVEGSITVNSNLYGNQYDFNQYITTNSKNSQNIPKFQRTTKQPNSYTFNKKF